MNIILFETVNIVNIFKIRKLIIEGKTVYYRSYKNGGLLINILLRIPGINRWFNQNVKQYKQVKGVAEYDDLFYKLQTWIIDATEEFYRINNSSAEKSLKYFSYYFKTDLKSETFAKRCIQMEIYEWVKWFAPFSIESNNDVTYFYTASPLKKYLIKKWQEDYDVELKINSESDFSFNLFYQYLSLLGKSFKFCFSRGVSLPFRRREFSVVFNPQFPTKEGLLSNDFFIDNKNIQENDVLFYFTFPSSDKDSNLVYKLITDKCYNHVFVNDLKIPFHKILNIFIERFIFPTCYFIIDLLSFKKNSFTMKNLHIFFTAIDEYGFGILNCHYNFKHTMLQSTAAPACQAAPIYGQKHGFKVTLYPIGTTMYRALMCDYAYQNFQQALTWGNKLFPLYDTTSNIDDMISIGFTGRDYYKKTLKNKDAIFDKFPSIDRSKPTVVFYDIPYFPDHGGISVDMFKSYYECMVDCAESFDFNVIQRTKNPLDPKRFPEDRRAEIEQLASRINNSKIILMDRSSGSIDPLDCIAISDVNVSIELSSPSTIALICKKPALFYNIVKSEYITHSLYPKYLDKLIFNDLSLLKERIAKIANKESTFEDLVDLSDIEAYDEPIINGSKDAFCLALIGKKNEIKYGISETNKREHGVAV